MTGAQRGRLGRVPYDRDVKAFDGRAPGYEAGWRGRLHHEISGRAVQVALAAAPNPRRVLDVGSGPPGCSPPWASAPAVAPPVCRDHPDGHGHGSLRAPGT